jgi:DNA (cytosine-5)-methyltransferase 1
MRRPIAIDLFSGAGGMSLGFEQAGFDVVAAVELDPVHAAVHSYNFPQCTVLPRSVVGLSGEEIRRAAKIGSRPIDVLFGGAPCQGFSLIGQRAFDDPRNKLVAEFVRLTRELDAKYFVFENVKGLTVGRHRAFLTELVSAFEEAGYNVRLPWDVLNAASFGVPQDRERLILMGAKRGLRLPEYPQGTKKSVTCAHALEDLPDAEEFSELMENDSAHVGRWKQVRSAYARELRGLANDSWHFGHPRAWDPSMLTSSMRTDHTEISRRRFERTAEGAVEPISRFFKLPAKGRSNTLRAGTDSARGAFTSPRPIHYAYARCVTVREMARLHGFPDWFRFHVTKWHGARQVGNAVPPPLARAIATALMSAAKKEPNKPTKALELGDPKLLHMDVSAAAKHWGVESPIGKRNMKTGAKKRSQIEIERQLALFQLA